MDPLLSTPSPRDLTYRMKACRICLVACGNRSCCALSSVPFILFPPVRIRNGFLCYCTQRSAQHSGCPVTCSGGQFLDHSALYTVPSMPRVKHVRRNDANTLVYFDVAISGGPEGTDDLGRVVFELYNDIAPKVYPCISFLPFLSAPAPPQASTYLTGATTANVARPQKIFASFALEKLALVKLQRCHYTSKALHSTES